MTALIDPQAQIGDPARFLSDEQRELVSSRRAICNTCDSKRRLTALTVNCRSCGCAGLSLLNGRCHLGKWPASDAQRGPGDVPHQAGTEGNANQSILENRLLRRAQDSQQSDLHRVVVKLERDAEIYQRSTPNRPMSKNRRCGPNQFTLKRSGRSLSGFASPPRPLSVIACGPPRRAVRTRLHNPLG